MKKVDKSFFIICIILFIAYGFFYIFTGHGIPCFFHELSGLYCPGCGITRMLLSLLRFDFYQAFRYNPLLFILCPVIGLTILSEIIYYFRNKNLYKINNNVYLVLAAVIIVYGVVRNIPAFSYLIPTVVK